MVETDWYKTSVSIIIYIYMFELFEKNLFHKDEQTGFLGKIRIGIRNLETAKEYLEDAMSYLRTKIWDYDINPEIFILSEIDVHQLVSAIELENFQRIFRKIDYLEAAELL